MKIKRFEASSMSEALRMIKKDFGEDAVILSAKNVKKAGRFFGSGGQQVVVTAATDMTPAIKSSEPEDGLNANLDDKMADKNSQLGEKNSARINTLLKGFEPITRTGREKLRPKLIQLISDSQASGTSEHVLVKSLYGHLRAQALSADIARDLAAQVSQLLPVADVFDYEIKATLSQVIGARGWVAPFRQAHSSHSRSIVLVGPHGAGKTASAAKLAADATLKGKHAVVLSLDHERIAAFAELERYTRIMGVQLLTASDEQQIDKVMQSTSEHQLMVVDTPGICLHDAERRKALGRMIERLGEAEIHLVMNACTHEGIMNRYIDFFKPLGVSRLLFTQVDWSGEIGHLINLMDDRRLAASYLGNGPQVPDGLCQATPEIITGLLFRDPAGSISMRERESAADTVNVLTSGRIDKKFVANRNSDIFHQVQCKSVRRINNENMLAFKDPDEAKEKGFKPCRMCCADLLIAKPIDRLVRSRMNSHR